MKKLLALVLALVMTLGLATVGASAATYSDDADITHDEAVAVMSAIGVLAGDNGAFNPTGILTREQGAKIITYMLMGGKEAGDALTAPSAPFADVAADRWSAGAIAYCKNAGIIAGVGNNQFNPTGTLTGYQFAKMLLVALGYDADIEKMVGGGWEFSVAKLITDINLADDIDSFVGSTGVSRDNAAQLAFNALTSTMVYYPSEQNVNISGTNAGGVSIGTNLQSSKSVEVENGNSTFGLSTNYKSISANSNANATPYTQLCEKYFPKLKLNVNGTDDLGRGANVWMFKGKEVINSAKTAKYTFVAKNTKSYATQIEDFNKSLKVAYDATNARYTATFYTNGAVSGTGTGTAPTTATALAAPAAAGDVIELYVSENDVNEVTNIVITQYQAHKVTGKVETKTASGVDQVRVPGVVNTWTNADKVFGAESVTKDDIAYFYRAANGNYYIYKAESFEGKLTTVTAQDGTTPAKYTIAGTAYMINGTAGESGDQGASNQRFNDTYTYYTDANGFIIYSTLVESTSKDYVLVYDLKYVASGSSSALDTNGVAQARLVFMDGTTKIVNIDKIDGFEPVNFDIDADGTGEQIGFLPYTGSGYTGATGANDSTSYTAEHIATTDTTITATTGVSTTAMTAGTYYVVTDQAAATTSMATGNWAKYLALSASNSVANRAATRDRLYTYTVDASGKYTLTDAENLTRVTTGGNATAGTVSTQAKTSVLSTTGTVISANVDSNTTFVVLNSKTSSTPSFTVYQGKDKCPVFGTNVAFAYASEGGVATNVVVTDYGTSTGGTYVYLLSNSSSTETTVKHENGTNTHYWIYKALVEGETEAKDIYLTDAANTYVTAGGRGIGMYTAPSFDDYGNYNALTWSTDNQGVTLGYHLNGKTLQVDRSYGSTNVTYGTAYDCPTDSVVIIKTSDGYTVGTAADLDEDANDQIYVTRTATAADNQTKIVYVVMRDADNTGIAGVSTSAGAATKANATYTINGEATSVTEYTVAQGAGTVTIATNSRSLVQRSSALTTATNYNNGTNKAASWATPTISTATTKAANGVSFGSASAGETYLVKVTAEDGVTVSYLAIIVTA